MNKIKGGEVWHKIKYVAQKHPLKGYELYAEMKKVFPYKYGEDYFKQYFIKNNVNDLINSDIHSFLPFSILKKVDMSSMANSLEIRCPFLDLNLFGFSASIPAEYKIHNAEKKYLLKKALEKRLPKSIIYRKKKGFSTPLKHYFRGELKGFVCDTLNEGRVSKITDIKKEEINILLERHLSKKETNTGRIFALLQLELFLKNLEKKREI